MTEEDFRRLQEETAYLEEVDKEKQRSEFDSQLHYDILRHVGFSNDQAVALISLAIDCVRIPTGLDANETAREIAKSLNLKGE